MLGRLLALVAALAVAFGSLTACGSTSDPVAWSDKVCGSFMPAMQKLTKRPKVSYRSPQVVQRHVSAILGDGIDAMDGMLTGLREAGEPPVEGGHRWAGQMRDALGKARKHFLKAKSTIDSADPRKPRVFLAAMKKVSRMPGASRIEKPFKKIRTDRVLNQAYRDAKNCQRLDRYMKKKTRS